MTAVVVDPAPRRRWVRWLILGLVALALIVAGIFVWLWVSGRAPVPGLDDAARAEVTQRIQQEVSGRLGIQPSDVAVDLGPTPILPQLERREIEEATIGIRLPSDRAVTLIAGAIGFDPGILGLGEGTLRLQTEIDAVVTKLTVGIGFGVRAADGELVFAPAEFVLAGNPIPLQDLLQTPVIGEWVQPLVEPRAFCVANLLPESLHLEDVQVTPLELDLTITGERIPLEATALSTTGTCD